MENAYQQKINKKTSEKGRKTGGKSWCKGVDRKPYRKVTAKEIKEALADYNPKDFFLTECKTCSTYFPDPQGMLKFDGVGIRKSYTRPCITGYEIKVSREDFERDFKWHLYLNYCNEFYFVCPAGLLKKEELPDNVGLIWYYPDSKKLMVRKKALWREIEEPVGMYRYIIISRLDRERIPFYEDRAEYARDYLADKLAKERLGREFGSRLAKDLTETQERLDSLAESEKQCGLAEQMKEIMKKHGVGKCCYTTEDWAQALDMALRNHYPEELDEVIRHIQIAAEKLSRIEEENRAGRSIGQKKIKSGGIVMGITNNQKMLIEAVAKNNIHMAKESALACIAEDTTAKNRAWRNYIEPRLKKTELEVPANLVGIMRMESADSFREDRYYASEKEQEVAETIVRMQAATAAMAELGLHYVNATLLYGESGTGKTLFGHYIAYRLGLPFCYVDFSGLIDSLMGGTGKNLRRVFAFVSQSPCVLMIDELDCIASKREYASGKGPDGEITRVVIQLIQELDRMPNDVVLIGATNRLDRTDAAIVRRFKQHEILPLGEEEKYILLKQYNDTTGNLFSEDELRSIAACGGKNQSYAIRDFIEKLAQKLSQPGLQQTDANT